MAYDNMIVVDQEFEKGASQLSAYFTLLENTLVQYKSILTNISTGAISSGKTHDALVAFMVYVDGVTAMLQDLPGRCETIVNNYIKDLEAADTYLYDAGVGTAKRDFTQKMYEHLVDCLDDPWCETTDSIGDWFYEKFQDTLDFFHADGVKKKLQNCHRSLLDYNDETADGLKLMFDEVHAIDRDYGRSIAGAGTDGDFYTSHFDFVCLTLYALRDMLREMAAVIDPAGGGFTVKSIQDRLGKAIGEISDFASQPWAASYFNGFGFPINDYIAEIDTFDTVMMILFEMFGITKDKLIHGGDGKLTWDEILAIWRMDGGYLLLKRLTGDQYDVYITKKQLLQVLKEMTEGYVYSGSDEEQAIDDCKTFLKYVKKYGKDWYDKLNKMRGEDGKLILDGRTRDAKKFKAFLDSLGNAQDILKYGSDGIDYIARLFCDYSKGIEVIDSFCANYAGDETVTAAAEEVRALYNKEFAAWAEEAYGIVAKHGLDYALKEAGKACPVVAVVCAIEEGIDTFGEVSGTGTKAKNMYDSLIYHKLYSSSYYAYHNALEHFQNQTPGTDEYTQAATDLENCFNLHKANIKAMYDAMAGASGGDKQAYYKYCARQAEKLSMKDGAEPDLLTFEEFCALAA